MEYKAFGEELVERLSKIFPEYDISLGNVNKPSGAYYGLVIKRANGTSGMAYNLDEVYKNFDFDDFDGEIEELSDAVKEGMKRDFSETTDKVSDYDFAKDRLFIMAERLDYDYAEKIPFISYGGDIMGTFRVVLETTDDGGLYSVVVTRRLAEAWGVGIEQITEDAFVSSKKILPEVIITRGNDDMEMYIVTNRSGTCGASAVWYPGVLENLAEVTGKNLYVIPSSKNEMIVRPDDGMMRAEGYRRMVNMMNKEISDDDVLSWCVFYYDRKKKVFREAY